LGMRKQQTEGVTASDLEGTLTIVVSVKANGIDNGCQDLVRQSIFALNKLCEWCILVVCCLPVQSHVGENKEG